MTNPEIVPCRMCKGRKGVVPPEIFGGSVRWIGCTTVGCGCTGPERTTEAEAIAAWNELMQPSAQAAPEPKAGTVRVPVAVSVARDDTTVIANDGTMWFLSPHNKWFQLPPLPQPETPGTVEASDD